MTENEMTLAIWADDTAAVKKFLDDGADVNARGRDGTPLQLALSAKGNSQVAELLIERGANVNASGVSPLALAASNAGYGYIISLLISKGAADVDGAVISAVENGFVHYIDMLMPYIKDLNAIKDENGKSLLMLAIDQSDADMVSYLLARGADASLKNGDETLAQYAARRGQRIIEKVLARAA